MSREKFRRRYLVNPRYQLTQAGVAIAANIVVALLMAVLMSWFYLFYLDKQIVCDHNRLFPLYVAVVILMVVLSSIFLSLHRSRTVAGMMRKLDIILRDAARGAFPDAPLVFRKGDFFGWLAQPLNDCLVLLKVQRDTRDAAVSSLLTLKQQIGAGVAGSEEITRDLDRIIADLNAPEKQEEVQ